MISGKRSPYGIYRGFNSSSTGTPIGTINGSSLGYSIPWIGSTSITKLEYASDPGFVGCRLVFSAPGTPANSGWYDIQTGTPTGGNTQNVHLRRVDATSNSTQYTREWLWGTSLAGANNDDTRTFRDTEYHHIVFTDNGLREISDIPASGAISLLDIQNEFGGSNPISISEYRYGGETGVPTDIPATGPVSFSDYYGLEKGFSVPERRFRAGVYNSTLSANMFSTSLLPGVNNQSSSVEIEFRIEKLDANSLIAKLSCGSRSYGTVEYWTETGTLRTLDVDSTEYVIANLNGNMTVDNVEAIYLHLNEYNQYSTGTGSIGIKSEQTNPTSTKLLKPDVWTPLSTGQTAGFVYGSSNLQSAVRDGYVLIDIYVRGKEIEDATLLTSFNLRAVSAPYGYQS